MASFFQMPGTIAKLNSSGVSMTEARKRLTDQLKEYGIPSGSFRKLSAGDQQKALDAALAMDLNARKSRDAAAIRNVKPCNPSLHHSQTNYVVRHGGTVIRGGEDVEQQLDKVGADAVHILTAPGEPGIILYRDVVSTSDVLEETYHFGQNLRGDYAGLPDDERTCRMEIDAQNYLLSVAERYKIPSKETEQTKRNLEFYQKELEDILGRRMEQ